MRRLDREIADRAELDAILRGALVCRLAFARGDEPYLLPLSFGFDGRALFFHTAPEGRKIGFLEGGGRVCFEVERNVRLREDTERACRWTFAFESVIGYGGVTELVAPVEKTAGLCWIMRHYSGREWELPPSAVAAVRVWRLDIQTMTGKRSAAKE